MKIPPLLLFLPLLLSGCLGAEPARTGTTTAALPAAVNDAALRSKLERECRRLAADSPDQARLTNQLSRARCELALPGRRTARLSAVETSRLCEKSTVIIGKLYLCPRCDQEHFSFASGFVLSKSGAVLTCRHVVARDTLRSLAVMSRDGTVLPVLDVLAADAVSDVVILRVEGGKLTPLPLASGAPVGTAVTVISHPDGAFYTLTSGMVSRYFADTRRRGQGATWMSITAPFAKGSSGAPVLDDCGNAVGIVNNTRSIYYDAPGGEKGDIQMVLDNCTPASEVFKLTRGGK